MAVINKGGVLVRDNFIHIHSTPHMNVLVPTKPKGFDKVFSVYTRPFVKEHGVKINCGAKNCLTCQLCYTHNDTEYVNELIKSNGHKD
jgi:hypothetical protein